ncbi:MAG: UDP-N-acetylglucosamine--N-acetylmuramyl-(pentapeptide) pyrophosphoryl-undecaprenol N-acetylglucosamine transferase [Candidatus Bathyarchaeia archaeon]
MVLVITAGGTGGHIFPALALGESLQKLNWNLLYIGRANSLEEDLIRKYNFDFFALPASGFLGKRMLGKINFFINFGLALCRWIWFAIRHRFSAVIATGGFNSLVPILGALIIGKPIFILELNRIPGRITKYFARFAQEIYLAFPLTQRTSGNFYYTGSPLRKGLLAKAWQCRNSFHCQSRTSNKPVILVLGGSLGARALNLAAVELANKYPTIEFIIQTGKRDYDLIKEKVRSENCQLIDFTLTPEENYAKATLVLTRAGGMALSEIIAFGLPSIIVPFPFATDQHQNANAKFLEKAGAAKILDQSHLSNLEDMINDLLANKEELERMRANALRLAKYDAAEIIAKRITRRLKKIKIARKDL